MVEIKELSVGTITETDKYNLFRFADGKVALNSSEYIVFDTTNENTVSLITVTTEEYAVSFFKVDNVYYALSLGSPRSISLPEKIEFCDIVAHNEEEGCYIKCKLGDHYGIIYVDEECIKCIINIDDGYTDISYKDGVFYAYLENDTSKYRIIDLNGKFSYAADTRYQKVEGFSVFFYENYVMCCIDTSLYNQKRIVRDTMSLRIKNNAEYVSFNASKNIISAQVLSSGEYSTYYNVIKVTTEEGNEYYSLSEDMTFELMLSTHKDDKIEFLDNNFIIISDYAEEKCISKTVLKASSWDVKKFDTLNCESQIDEVGYYRTYYDFRPKGILYFCAVDKKYLYVLSLDSYDPCFNKVYERFDVNNFRLYSTLGNNYIKGFHHVIVGSENSDGTNIPRVMLVYDVYDEIKVNEIYSTFYIDANFTIYNLKGNTTICVRNSDSSIIFVVQNCVKCYKGSGALGLEGEKEDSFIIEESDGTIRVIPISAI